MNALLSTLAGILFTQVLQIGIVFLIVTVACRLLRRASAHWRYLLWLLVIAKCLTPPVISFSLPVLPDQRMVDASSSAPEQFAMIGQQTTATGDSYVAASPGSIRSTKIIGEQIATNNETESLKKATIVQSDSVVLSPHHGLVLAWLAGSVIFILIMVLKIRVTRRKIIRSRVASCEKMQRILVELAGTLGLKKLPKLYTVEFATQPFVWGWLRGDIYLSPNLSKSCSQEKCRTIIAHELAHVCRWDAAINHVQNVVQALFFFHPLVWIANKRLRMERERCCDEAVLADRANSRHVYAEAILDVLTYESTPDRSTPVLAVTGAIKDLKVRLATIVAPNRIFRRRPSPTATITCLLLAACVLPTMVVLTRNSAAVDERIRRENLGELKKFKWRLLDDEGKPIQGVLVTAAGMRCKEEPTTGYGWPTKFTPITEYVSDSNGEVEVEYPVAFGFVEGQELTTTTLIFRCKHEQYVAPGDIEVGVAVTDFTRTLERGCEAALTCRGPDGVLIRNFATIMPGWDREIWKLKDGQLQCGGLPVGGTQTMVVVPAADGKHLFSEPVDLLCSKEKVFTSEIVVHPGMVLRGKLADNVPRPIEHGKIIAFCVPKPLGPSFLYDPAVSWTDEAVISADGSFEFASLPRSESIQLIALCRGWITDRWGEDLLARGEVIKLERGQIASQEISDVILTMEQAGSIEVLVLDQDGMPVAGADVGSWPNQAYSHDSGTTLLGFCYKSIELAKSQIAGRPAPIANLNLADRYNAQTSKEGSAVLYEIPLHKPQFLQAFHDDLVQKGSVAAGTLYRGLEFQCVSPDRKKLTVHMERPKKAASSKDTAATKPDVQKTKKFAPSILNAKVVKFEVDLLSEDEFLKLMQERTVSISPTMRKAVLDYTDGIQDPNPLLESAIQDLRDGKDGLTLDKVVSILRLDNPSATEVAKQLLGRDDPVLQFAVNLALATRKSDDRTAAQALYRHVHDKGLQQVDRQLICTWCSSIGIRADDTAAHIQQHFATVTSGEVNLKPGELAPEFEFESDTGTVIRSKEMQGKTIVLHFWATSCGACMGQMPEHVKSFSRLDQSQVEVLFVSLDDNKEKFLEAVEKFQIPFTNLRDERGWGGDLVRAFGVRSMPFDVIIGPDGTIVSNSIQDLRHLMK